MALKTLALTLALASLTAIGARADIVLNSSDDADTPRNWAIMAGMGLTCPTATNPAQLGTLYGKTASFGSPGFTLMAERYIRGSHFSIVGGYACDEVYFFGGEITATMHNIQVGARYYPLSPGYAVQPYAQLAALANVGDASLQGSLTCSGSYDCRRDYNISCPRVSAVPTIGADIYILSSLALEVQYGYAIAIGGKARIATAPSEQGASYMAHSDMHRHLVTIGLKLTFPFHITESDCYNIIDMLFGIYDGDRPHETKSDRKKAHMQRVLDSY